MRVVVQPRELDNGTLPYPFFIDETGLVGRQDFWKGKPYKLMGFNGSSANKTVEPACGLEEFLKNPNLAIGKYPIFEYKNGDWHTGTNAIESVREIE